MKTDQTAHGESAASDLLHRLLGEHGVLARAVEWALGLAGAILLAAARAGGRFIRYQCSTRGPSARFWRAFRHRAGLCARVVFTGSAFYLHRRIGSLGGVARSLQAFCEMHLVWIPYVVTICGLVAFGSAATIIASVSLAVTGVGFYAWCVRYAQKHDPLLAAIKRLMIAEEIDVAHVFGGRPAPGISMRVHVLDVAWSLGLIYAEIDGHSTIIRSVRSNNVLGRVYRGDRFFTKQPPAPGVVDASGISIAG